MVFYLLVGVAIAISGVWTAYRRLKVRDREAELPQVARAKGLQFSPEDPFGSKVVAFSLFTQGDGSRLENVMWNGDDPAQAAGSPDRAFDFGWYRIHHDKGREYKEWHWSSCAMAQPDGSFPTLQIAPHHLWDKALDMVHGDPIRFESEGFNDTFRVTCEDRRFASALVDPQMMQFLLETKALVSFATKGRFVLAWGPEVAPDEMPILLGLVGEFVRRIPNAVWELYPKATPLTPEERGPGPDAILAEGQAEAALGGDEDAWDPTPGVDYDLEGHAVAPHVEDPWHDHALRPRDTRPPDAPDLHPRP